MWQSCVKIPGWLSSVEGRSATFKQPEPPSALALPQGRRGWGGLHGRGRSPSLQPGRRGQTPADDGFFVRLHSGCRVGGTRQERCMEARGTPHAGEGARWAPPRRWEGRGERDAKPLGAENNNPGVVSGGSLRSLRGALMYSRGDPERQCRAAPRRRCRGEPAPAERRWRPGPTALGFRNSPAAPKLRVEAPAGTPRSLASKAVWKPVRG